MDSAISYNRPMMWNDRPIRSWAAFYDVVTQCDQPLLATLNDYADCILVAGCQLSGTTALARLLKRVDDFVDHTFGHDDELDGALLLSGHVPRGNNGRHCFETTYVNDRYAEYFAHRHFRLIWMLREPRSVVYSMIHNWSRSALSRLYNACGAHVLAQAAEPPTLMSAWLGPSRLTKACASYVGKTAQTFALLERLGERMAIVDYDELIAHKHTMLPALCEFSGVRYDGRLAQVLHDRSVHERGRLGRRDTDYVDRFCATTYGRAYASRTLRPD